MFKTPSKFYHESKLLDIPNHLVEYVSNTHIISKRRRYTKPKGAVKFVKGLPHLCHMQTTESKERVSNVHEVNNNKTQLLFMSHNHVRHNHTFCIIKYTYCQ